MWDSIMGVGKTPQVTSDVLGTNYTIKEEDINQVALITSSLGANMAESGSLLNLQNPFFDYVTNQPYSQSNTGFTFGTGYVYFDLGKIILLRGFKLYLKVTSNSGTDNYNISIATSEDGITYTTRQTLSGSTAASVDLNFSIQDVQARIIRVTNYIDSAGTGQTRTDFLTFQIKMNTSQYLNRLI